MLGGTGTQMVSRIKVMDDESKHQKRCLRNPAPPDYKGVMIDHSQIIYSSTSAR